MHKLSLHIFLTIYISIFSAHATTIIVDGNSATTNQAGTVKKPYNTIQMAVNIAKPGDTIQIKTGIYREKIKIITSGTQNKPITITAAENNKVIVSGMQKITNWIEYADGIYSAHINFKPTRLYMNTRRETLSRKPNEGWWKSEDAKNEIITDTVNLQGLKNNLSGAEAYIWTQHGNTYYTVPMKNINTSKGILNIKRTSKWMKLTAGDKYYLQNQLSLIDKPGEWSYKNDGESWLLYYRPHNKQELMQTEVPFINNVISAQKNEYININGLEVIGSTGHGIVVNKSNNIKINFCSAYNNNSHGINIRDSKYVIISNCVSYRNYCGITVESSKHITVEQCEIAYNGMDGLLFTWKADNLIARRNYIHDHLLWGHPDNTQFYRDVINVKFIDNLLMTSGQTIMMQETSNGEFRGNTFVGSEAMMLIFGHNSSHDYKIYNNTFAFTGYGCMNLSDKNYDVQNNVFMTGTRNAIYGTRNITGYTGSRNLFWNADNLTNKTVLISDKGWHTSLKEFQDATGQDLNSIYANPKFINAPLYFAVMDSKKIDLYTRDTFYIRHKTDIFKIGDHTEFNFDGIDHTITKVTDNTISITPPLTEKPIKPWVIANWKDNKNFKMDLRLRKSSPGSTLAENSSPIGSKIDIQAYKRGDFNNDGKRDIPVIIYDN